MRRLFAKPFACRGRRARSFSLVELLVVIAAIALLVGILLPALKKAKDAAAAIQCAGQSRQIGVGMNLYAGDYYWWLPQKPDNPTDYRGNWIYLIKDYVSYLQL